MKIKEVISVLVNHSVARLAGFMEFYELLTNSAKSVEASERIVAGEVGGSGPGDEVVELSGERFNLPGPAEKVFVRESHVSSSVASDEEVALETERGDAGKDFHDPYGRTVEAAGDPSNHEVLDACHVLEIFEGASPVEHVPKQQPIGKYGDHAGVVAHDTLSRS